MAKESFFSKLWSGKLITIFNILDAALFCINSLSHPIHGPQDTTSCYLVRL